MKYAGIHRLFARGPAAGVSDSVFGAWSRLALVVADRESLSPEAEKAIAEGTVTEANPLGDGLILNCKDWNERRWHSTAGTTPRGVESVIRSLLGCWEGVSLRLYGCDLWGVMRARSLRSRGAKGGRPRTQEKPVVTESPGLAQVDPSLSPAEPEPNLGRTPFLTLPSPTLHSGTTYRGAFGANAIVTQEVVPPQDAPEPIPPEPLPTPAPATPRRARKPTAEGDRQRDLRLAREKVWDLFAVKFEAQYRTAPDARTEAETGRLNKLLEKTLPPAGGTYADRAEVFCDRIRNMFAGLSQNAGPLYQCGNLSFQTVLDKHAKFTTPFKPSKPDRNGWVQGMDEVRQEMGLKPGESGSRRIA